MPDLDPRIVALYDGDNPDGPDHDFDRALAAEVGARSIVDLGCGTGMLTVSLATAGRRVVGVDPSAAMLDAARSRPGGDAVEWIHGDSRALPAGPFDLAFLTGNVVQHIPDPEWIRTLADLRRALRPGGTLTFESRNPADRAWESWAGPATTRDTAHGPLEEWAEVEETGPGVVRVVFHSRFVAAGELVSEVQPFAFRDRATLTAQLDAAGFDVDAVHGDFARGPLTASSRVMVFVARAR
ncbi:bifunctional 2-polyprenyl-6-hydroxyphenol methylase/3-demethylubiquinol 3-O-methyltransferase UbiG [Clavibacter sp. VKM Ac-2872]|uniref:class I SAM-dependent methyltransferase n=1 Tax=Clavibacter sp. VKM Ac-2872 TaxID=2783812 RepID=UPI00188AF83D|nr:class I SAM-dependent methyltransferase [Clavibacter sp. VKM Ac-2872]MBF4624945.1 class I SAM-dependent methyltransferase [Clavibacter sp. VKM Ac-2872]